MNGMATQAQDSELQHSFGPQEIGFDYLPLELTPPDGVVVRTAPAAKLPFIDLASNTPFELPEAPLALLETNAPARPLRKANGKPVDRSPGTLWLEGDVLMCACPDCRAPMSVRLWLMAADCWKCGASIELSQEQEREALRLLNERDAAAAEAPARESAPAPPPAPARPTPPPPPPEARAPRFREGPAAPPAPAPSQLPIGTPPLPTSAPAAPAARRAQLRRR